MIIERSEYEKRLAGFQKSLRDAKVDVAIVDRGEPMQYLTGYESGLTMYRACLVPSSGSPIMVLREMDADSFTRRSWFDKYIGFNDWDDELEVVAKAIDQMRFNAGRVGVDLQSYALTVKSYQRLRTLLPNVAFIDTAEEQSKLALLRSGAEIELTKKAAAIVDESMRRTIASASVGKTERQIAAVAAQAHLDLGADYARPGLVTKGIGENFLHCASTDAVLASGDILHLELLPHFRGYAARLMRPVVMGEPTPEQQKIAKEIIAVQDRQIEALKPGAVAKEIDAIVREGLLNSNLRQTYCNITGYTLGYYPPLSPRSSNFHRCFRPGETWVVEEGMILHMYCSAQGIAFSETLVVRSDGAEILTKTPRQLFTSSL